MASVDIEFAYSPEFNKESKPRRGGSGRRLGKRISLGVAGVGSYCDRLSASETRY